MMSNLSHRSVQHPLHDLPRPIGILAEGSQSTKAYWLEGAQATYKHPEQIRDLDCKKKIRWEELSGFQALVIIRMVPDQWFRLLSRLRQKGVQIALLLDDNLLDPLAISEQPLAYRWRIWRGITRHRNRLDQLFSELWVTTPALASACKQQITGQNVEIKMMPLEPLSTIVQTPTVFRIAYLGTASHQEELQWMLSVLHKLQSRRSDCLIEVVVSAYWRRRYRLLPRTRCFYTMDWDTYLLDTGNRKVDLLLVPLLANRFNHGRSPTKFFEAARLNAAGIYSARNPYKDFVRSDVDGILLPDIEEAWLKTVEELLDRPRRISELAARCRQRALSSCVD